MNKQNNNNDTIRTEPEGFITKETLAIRLSRTVRTVENWQRRGIIPYVKCGRCVLFKWTDVETHLQTHFRVCGHSRPKLLVAASRESAAYPAHVRGRTRRLPRRSFAAKAGPRRPAQRRTALRLTPNRGNERHRSSVNSVPSVSSVLKKCVIQDPEL